MTARTPLTNRNCLITGATGGIGRAIAVELARAGCNIFATATRAEKLEQLCAELADYARPDAQIAFEPADLADSSDIDRLAANALQRMESIDILVNSAGLFPVGPACEVSTDEFDRCFAVNVRAPFLLCRAFTANMIARRWGRILNIGSSSAYAGFKDTAVYCASKHALLGLSRSLFNELKDHNIRTFCLSPGSVKTDMGRLVRDQDFSTFIEPEELARFAVDILSYDGTMITEEVRLNRMVIR